MHTLALSNHSKRVDVVPTISSEAINRCRQSVDSVRATTDSIHSTQLVRSTLRSEREKTLYREVYGGPPWNDYFVCSACWERYGQSHSGPCACGGSLNISYDDNYLQDLSGGHAGEGDLILTAENQWEKVGFILGNSAPLTELCEQNFLIAPEVLTPLLQRQFPDIDTEHLYYFSDVGVRLDYRWKRIASLLYSALYEHAQRASSASHVVLFTLEWSPAALWFDAMGYQRVYSYSDGSGKIIMARVIDRAPANGV